MSTGFYVYEWYVVTTGEVFYVGKGTKNRYKTLMGRNKFFLDVYKSHECNVRIVCDNLTEHQAFQKEIALIKHYREKYPQYRLTNQTAGGEGVSGWEAPEWYRELMRRKNMGANNPNYNNKWSDEQKAEASNRMVGKYCDSKNPNSRRVMCVETGIIYSTEKEAIEANHIKDQSNMSAALKEKYRTAGGLHWVDETMFEMLSLKTNRDEYLKDCYLKNSHIRPIVCIDTNTIYKSIAELSLTLGVAKNTIRYSLEHKGCFTYNNLTYYDLTKVALCSDA